MDNEIECTSCGWQGYVSNLIATDDDPESFDYCPDCESSDHIQDLEPEE